MWWRGVASEQAVRVSVLTRSIAGLHSPGGLERAVAEQVRLLATFDTPLTVVTRPPDSARSADTYPTAIRDRVRWRFVRYRFAPLRHGSVPDRLVNYPLFTGAVARTLRHQPDLTGDIVHGHGLLAAAAPVGVPLVYSPHGLEEFSRADWRKWLIFGPMRQVLRRAARRAAAVLATDNHLAPAVTAALGVARNRVVVIPNGVDVATLDALVDQERALRLADRHGLDAASLRLVTCARLEANKGLSVMVRSLAAQRTRLPPAWGWWIIGMGHEEDRLRREIAVTGLQDHIHLLGHLDDGDLHSLLTRMDLFVLPSLYEGSSIATLEAMTHRLPVLATAVGGLPDKVLPGDTGWLVAPGDADALGATLVAAVTERDRWPEQGRAGRALVLARFDWPSIARVLLDLYTVLTRAAR